MIRWIVVGHAGRWVPRRAITLNYYLEEGMDTYGKTHYRARNIKTDALIPLSGNNGQNITNFVVFDDNPENHMSSSWYPMMGYPYVLSPEVAGWFYTVLHKLK